MSQWQTITDAVGTLLATIKVSNGYSTNGGLSLHQDLPHPLEQEKLPAYSWADTDCENDAEAEIGRLNHRLAFTVDACASGTTCRKKVRGMLEDVVTALGLDDTLGGTCQRITLESRSISSTQTEKKIANGTITFTIIYRTARFTL